MSVAFKDNSQQVLAQIQENMKKCLTAIGLAIVEITTDYMEYRYGKAIRITGDLIRSITFDVDTNAKIVAIGSNLNYSVWVHNGTRRMSARPFLKDAIMENMNVIEEILVEYLGEGFNISFQF